MGELCFAGSVDRQHQRTNARWRQLQRPGRRCFCTGEGLMDPIKPGEKRLLSYAADLGLLVDAREKEDKQQATWVAIKHGIMTHVSEERQERTYTIRNRDTTARTVVIEHPI